MEAHSGGGGSGEVRAVLTGSMVDPLVASAGANLDDGKYSQVRTTAPLLEPAAPHPEPLAPEKTRPLNSPPPVVLRPCLVWRRCGTRRRTSCSLWRRCPAAAAAGPPVSPCSRTAMTLRASSRESPPTAAEVTEVTDRAGTRRARRTLLWLPLLWLRRGHSQRGEKRHMVALGNFRSQRRVANEIRRVGTEVPCLLGR